MLKEKAARICLITPGHVSSTPRLVKEADALAAAGYDVHVVAGQYFPRVEPLDLQVLERARWSCSRVAFTKDIFALPRKINRAFARFLISNRWSNDAGTAARAHHAHLFLLAREAMKHKARLYLGHCLGGLAAAGHAAARQGSLLGFDIEDIHGMETDFQLQDAAESTASRIIQEKWIPRCTYLGASSEAIAGEYARLYGKTSSILHNVFPLSESPPRPFSPEPFSSGRPARFYWFSQVVGPQRGLEEALDVMAHMKTPVELHLRGICSDDYKTFLNNRAARLGLKNPVVFHPLGDPAEMAILAAPYDLGLSIELQAPPNRDYCLTNKIFCYLMAGIPQWMSETSAQTILGKSLGPCVIIAPLQDPSATATRLDQFLSDPERIIRARELSWNLGHTTYCWDSVQSQLVESVSSLLSKS